MAKELTKEFLQTRTRRSVANHAHLNYKTKIQDISDALTSSGYLSLDAQAQALGVCRSTTWTIVRATHKINRLSAKITRQMLSNPNLPPAVRLVVEQYEFERSENISN